MSKLDQASREAWQWVESTEASAITIENIHTAYRLKFPPCKPGKCKKNCRINPQCLAGMGEKVWLEELKVPEEEPDDPCNVVRKEGDFVGLTNLGATCYVNSLVQLWFHNPVFRKAIYAWNPRFDPLERDNQTLSMLEEGGFLPSSPVGSLQFLFAQMQFSRRSCVNPTSFITSLGLDFTTQQDAQEFSKLFVCNMLEEPLSHQPDSTVSSMVQRQFRGLYEYITRCCKCKKETSSPSPFYELDLSLGSKTDLLLEESLAEFLQEEKLEGSDQYFCEACESKQNATRRIRLRSLPPVLNIQLLRFVFDRKTGHKKKLSSIVHFPEVMTMESYVQPTPNLPPTSLTYDLAAVLIHRGPSAYSGHYVAHIKDQESSVWYKFNDEIVEKQEGNKFNLGIEEDLDDSKKGRSHVKSAKGSHASNNAYMLVYTRRDPDSGKKEKQAASSTVLLPPWIQTALHEENDHFEKWNRDVNLRKADALRKRREKHAKMRQIYTSLPCRSLAESQFMSSQWLTSWLSGDDKLEPVNNSPLLCEHAKLNPDKFREYKLISSIAAETLYGEHKGGPRLDINSLCWDCVSFKCAATRLRSRLDADSKIVANLMKGKLDPNQPNFWVGKESLKSWKKMVLIRHKFQERETARSKLEVDVKETTTADPARRDSKASEVKEVNGHTNGHGVLKSTSEPAVTVVKSVETDRSRWQAEFDKSLSDDRPSSAASDGDYGFNEDLLCSHGKLSADEGPRKLVQPAVWNIFHQYFPEAREFRSTDLPCELCTRLADEEGKTREYYKLLANDQRLVLQDLFRHKNRPDPAKPWPSEVHVLPKDVIDKWRAFIKDPTKKEPVLSISSSELFCHHGGLTHRPAPDLESETNFVYLWPEEWAQLIKYAHVDGPSILLRRTRLDDGGISLDTQPAVCESCLAERLEEERRLQLDYTRAVIYVRQVCPTDKSSNGSTMGDNGGSGLLDMSSTSAGLTDQDPDFQVCSESKKPRLDSHALASCPSPASPTTSAQQIASRRSQRQRRGRGEKEITVSSDLTLLQLKREIMKKFQVAPFDQHLSCNGRDLNDNQATLASLRIYPGTLIILQADEPSEDPSLMEDYARTAIPEEGFKGTGLLRS